MCLHRHLPATSDTSTVFLSAKSFLDPFEHLSNMETKRMVQNYVAYLKDDTRLITNPGLKVTTHFGYLYFTGFVSYPSLSGMHFSWEFFSIEHLLAQSADLVKFFSCCHEYRSFVCGVIDSYSLWLSKTIFISFCIMTIYQTYYKCFRCFRIDITII